MDGLVAHIEEYLGFISGGWSQDAGGVPLQFQILDFADRPDDGLVTYSTLGLSKHVIPLPTQEIRQELVMCVRRPFAGDHIVSVLAFVGELLIDRHQAIPRGEVLRNGGPIPPDGPLDSLYVATPSMLPDSFGTFASDPPTEFVWLVPINDMEADLVATHGWPWFEEQLSAQRPDLYDLHRAGISHGP